MQKKITAKQLKEELAGGFDKLIEQVVQAITCHASATKVTPPDLIPDYTPVTTVKSGSHQYKGPSNDAKTPKTEVFWLFGIKLKEGVKDERENCVIQLTTQEKNFLMDVWQHPTSQITARYQRLSFSCCFGNKLQNSLIQFGTIASSIVVLPRGRIKILTLKEKGKQVLVINSGESDRQGGPEHRYWAKRIADHLRARGYEVVEELPVGDGKTIDIVTTRGGKRIAFEIETGKSDAIANVRKCLYAELNAVVMVAVSSRARDKLFSTLPRDKKVRLLTAQELLRGNRG